MLPERLLLMLIWYSRSYGQNPYCELDLEHTLCQFQDISSTCGTPVSRGFNASERLAVVSMHNRLRATVAMGRETRGRSADAQPAAANMMSVRWDEELAAAAQRWADQCRFAHDDSRDVERFAVGQNIFQTGGAGAVQPLADTLREGIIGVNGWYSEVKQFDSSGIDRYRFEPMTGHYTQLVWAETEFVGCGHITYPTGRNGMTRLLVCNYGPAGNFVDQPVYIRARPCSMCPFQSSCLDGELAGLCQKSGESAAAATTSAPPVTFFPTVAPLFPTTTTTATTTTTSTTTAPRVVFMPSRQPNRLATTNVATIFPTRRPGVSREALADLLRSILRDSSEEVRPSNSVEDSSSSYEYEDYSVDLESEALRNSHTAQIPQYSQPYFYGDTPYYLGHGSYQSLRRPWQLNYLPSPRSYQRTKKKRRKKGKKSRRLGAVSEEPENNLIANNAVTQEEQDEDVQSNRILPTASALTQITNPSPSRSPVRVSPTEMPASNPSNEQALMIMMETTMSPMTTTMMPPKPPRKRKKNQGIFGGIRSLFGKVHRNIFG